MASAKAESIQPKAAGSVEAWVVSQEFVKRTLKSPSTADFGGVFHDPQSAEECCKKRNDDTWRCSGWVDSQNGFGATVRTRFSVTVKSTNGDWTAEEGPTLIQQ
jgi:hypothetical protein